jgi:hypothetical protein
MTPYPLLFIFIIHPLDKNFQQCNIGVFLPTDVFDELFENAKPLLSQGIQRFYNS